MLSIIIKALLVTLLVVQTAAFAQDVKIIGPRSNNDVSHDYFFKLLQLALDATGNGKNVVIISHQTQGRAIELLKTSDVYDILWTAGSEERDKNLRKISIPLFLGGLGIRGAVVTEDFNQTYSQLKSIQDFKPYLACQGQHWPDAKILKDGGIRVVSTVHFESLLQMVALNRCEFLPLSIFEGRGEVARFKEKYPNLVFNTDLLLHYDLGMYYFVNSKNESLALEVEQGLKKMQKDGSLKQFMHQHPLTKDAFPIDQFIESTFISIDGSKLTLLEQVNK